MNQPRKHWDAKRFERKGKYFDFAFVGESVASIRFGSDIDIVLNDNFQTRISLSSFVWTQYGQSQICDSQEPIKLAPLLSLIGCKVMEATAADQAPLCLKFGNGAEIEAPANHGDSSAYQWETWQIADSYGFQVVCAVGGQLFVWMPNAEIARRRDGTS